MGEGQAVDDATAERAALDPLARALAQPLAPAIPPAPRLAEADAGAGRARPAFDQLVQELVRRIAWSREGDGRGVVRLELGRSRHAGALAGAVVLLRAEGGAGRTGGGGGDDLEVEVEAEGVDPASLEALRAAVRRRLTARRGRAAAP